jgi:UDP-N-acetylmuramoyl-tripeptide--D-alanyl-D-alanine ligase
MPTDPLRLWTGPLPTQELFPEHGIDPLVHWIIHPIKRRIAKYYLQLLQKYFGIKVIAITGSAGKTTAKEMLQSILSLVGPTVSTTGNITPTFNIPTTILRATHRTRFLILEMGVEYPGDMDFYTWLARPDIGVITTVNRTHTLFLGALKDVALEKGKLLKVLPKTGSAVVNADDSHIAIDTQAKLYKFGANKSNYTEIVSASVTPQFTTSIKLVVNGKPLSLDLPFTGTHFSFSAAAAATVASLLGVNHQIIEYGLNHTPPPPHRLRVLRFSQGPIIIDDAYNANPLAVAASLETLMSVAKITGLTPVFAFGQMNELGQYETSAHEEIGTLVKQLAIKSLFTTGPATKHTLTSAGFGQYFETRDQLRDHLKQFLTAQHVVLIKASRSFQFEDMVEDLSHLYSR